MSLLVEVCFDVVVMLRHLNNLVLPIAGYVVAMSGQCHDIGWLLSLTARAASDVTTLSCTVMTLT